MCCFVGQLQLEVLRSELLSYPPLIVSSVVSVWVLSWTIIVVIISPDVSGLTLLRYRLFGSSLCLGPNLCVLHPAARYHAT